MGDVHHMAGLEVDAVFDSRHARLRDALHHLRGNDDEDDDCGGVAATLTFLELMRMSVSDQ
jgi:hypothetical protein